MSEDARTDDVVDAPVIGADGDETGRVVTDVSAEAADGNPDDPEPGTAVGDDAQVESAPGPQADGDSEDDSVPEDHDDSADGDDDSDEDDDSDGSSDNPLDSEAEIAADYLEELLDIADLDGDIDTYIEGDRAHVSVITESDVLVGRDGEVLDALQELTRLAVMTETGDRSRLMLDVAGFRDRRRKELLQLTADSVEQVKSSSERLKLTAMNPFERKIVHDAVAGAGLTSESEGEEPNRCVVIIP